MVLAELTSNSLLSKFGLLIDVLGAGDLAVGEEPLVVELGEAALGLGAFAGGRLLVDVLLVGRHAHALDLLLAVHGASCSAILLLFQYISNSLGFLILTVILNHEVMTIGSWIMSKNAAIHLTHLHELLWVAPTSRLTGCGTSKLPHLVESPSKGNIISR